MGCCFSFEKLNKKRELTLERKEFEPYKNDTKEDQFSEQILKRIEDVIGMIEEDQRNCEKWHKDTINVLNDFSSPLLHK